MEAIMGVVAAGWCLAAVVVSYRNIRGLLDQRRARRDMAAHDPYGEEDRGRAEEPGPTG